MPTIQIFIDGDFISANKAIGQIITETNTLQEKLYPYTREAYNKKFGPLSRLYSDMDIFRKEALELKPNIKKTFTRLEEEETKSTTNFRDFNRNLVRSERDIFFLSGIVSNLSNIFIDNNSTAGELTNTLANVGIGFLVEGPIGAVVAFLTTATNYIGKYIDELGKIKLEQTDADFDLDRTLRANTDYNGSSSIFSKLDPDFKSIISKLVTDLPSKGYKIKLNNIPNIILTVGTSNIDGTYNKEIGNQQGEIIDNLASTIAEAFDDKKKNPKQYTKKFFIDYLLNKISNVNPILAKEFADNVGNINLNSQDSVLNDLLSIYYKYVISNKNSITKKPKIFNPALPPIGSGNTTDSPYNITNNILNQDYQNAINILSNIDIIPNKDNNIKDLKTPKTKVNNVVGPRVRRVTINITDALINTLDINNDELASMTEQSIQDTFQKLIYEAMNDSQIKILK